LLVQYLTVKTVSECTTTHLDQSMKQKKAWKAPNILTRGVSFKSKVRFKGWKAYQNLSKKSSARQIRILIFFPYCEDDVFECNVD